VIGVDRRTPLGAEHQVQLDRLGRPARFDPSQRYRLGLPAGETQAGLLQAVLAQRLDGERWQGQDGAAGSGLDRPDRQFLAPAARVGVGDGQDGRVDGERLVEPDRAGVQVQVGPFQAAQLAVAGAGRRRQHRPGAKPGAGGVVGGVQQQRDLLGGQRHRLAVRPWRWGGAGGDVMGT
jgi:hypothetical protein